MGKNIPIWHLTCEYKKPWYWREFHGFLDSHISIRTFYSIEFRLFSVYFSNIYHFVGLCSHFLFIFDLFSRIWLHFSFFIGNSKPFLFSKLFFCCSFIRFQTRVFKIKTRVFPKWIFIWWISVKCKQKKNVFHWILDSREVEF